MAKGKVGGAIAVVFCLGLGFVAAAGGTETGMESSTESILQELGISPRPETCQGCAAEEAALAAAAATLAAAYTAYTDAEQALQDCEMQQRSAIADSGKSILIQN